MIHVILTSLDTLRALGNHAIRELTAPKVFRAIRVGNDARGLEVFDAIVGHKFSSMVREVQVCISQPRLVIQTGALGRWLSIIDDIYNAQYASQTFHPCTKHTPRGPCLPPPQAIFPPLLTSKSRSKMIQRHVCHKWSAYKRKQCSWTSYSATHQISSLPVVVVGLSHTPTTGDGDRLR